MDSENDTPTDDGAEGRDQENRDGANEFPPAPQGGDPAPRSTAPAQDASPAAEPHRANRRRRRSLVLAGAAAGTALVLGLGAGFAGYAVGASTSTGAAQSATGSARIVLPQQPSSGSAFGSGATTSPYGSASGSTQAAPVTATADQVAGVVTIVSELDYGAGEAAGTGIIATSDGTILTNNHVIDGATSIEVTDESTGATYSASVVGYDPSQDVAVLQLDGASGLSTAQLDPSQALAVGDTITSVGNAEGTGTLVATTGTIDALDQTITAGDSAGGDSEQLSGLLELDADVVSGDSGGPLLDSDGDVVGIVTAASSGSPTVTGYAIQIDVAIAVWQQIESGQETATTQLGLPAFLGVQLSSRAASGAGAVLGGVLDGSPAALAGLQAGDVITAVDGTAVGSADDLSAAISAHEPGEVVQLTYLDATGASASVSVTLTEGPAA